MHETRDLISIAPYKMHETRHLIPVPPCNGAIEYSV